MEIKKRSYGNRNEEFSKQELLTALPGLIKVLGKQRVPLGSVCMMLYSDWVFFFGYGFVACGEPVTLR